MGIGLFKSLLVVAHTPSGGQTKKNTRYTGKIPGSQPEARYSAPAHKFSVSSGSRISLLHEKKISKDVSYSELNMRHPGMERTHLRPLRKNEPKAKPVWLCTLPAVPPVAAVYKPFRLYRL
jgi:hypothetical protein